MSIQGNDIIVANVNANMRSGTKEKVSDATIELFSAITPNPDIHATLNHWNHEEWFGNMTNVSGKGKYRFNQYGRYGFAHWQYRFTTKDEAIEWLCHSRQYPVRQVTDTDAQYHVRTYYMEGY